MTPILKSLIHKRWRAFREKKWPVFRHYKEKVKSEIKKAKRFWCEKESKTSRGLWNVVRSFRGSGKTDPWRRLIDEAGGLNEFLSALTNEFHKNFSSEDDDVELFPLSEQEWTFHVTPEVVFYHLSRLNCRKATGPDRIPPILLKLGAQFICRPLAALFNMSIKQQNFPASFKHAHICPIPKSSSPRVCDFRPISILSPFSKVFERIVLDHVKQHLLSCYGPHQHAYRPMGSTTTALIELCEYVTLALDCKHTSHVNIFCLDLSRAFDKLQHHRLLNYLSVCGFNHGFLCWLRSYLCSRTMSVKLMNSYGPTVVIPSGVPQGSVLGPFLFAAFMGSVNFSGVNLKSIKYADDVTIIESVSRGQFSSVNLDNCISIFNAEGLVVNRSKCKQLRMCRLQLCDSQDCGFIFVDTLKILGLTFTDRYSWCTQISNVLKVASQRFYIIRCLKNCLSTPELVQVYHTLITSLFLYASPVYGQLPSTLMAKLEKFQKRTHRLICGSGCECGAFPLLCSRFRDAAVQTLLRSEANQDHPLHGLVPERLPASNHFRIPACVTTRRLNFFPLGFPIM